MERIWRMYLNGGLVKCFFVEHLGLMKGDTSIKVIVIIVVVTLHAALLILHVLELLDQLPLLLPRQRDVRPRTRPKQQQQVSLGA